MKTTIGSFNHEAGTVRVNFADAGVTFERDVNACLKNGEYDAEATAERVAQVALGVARKIALGVITNAPPPDATEPAPTE